MERMGQNQIKDDAHVSLGGATGAKLTAGLFKMWPEISNHHTTKISEQPTI